MAVQNPPVPEEKLGVPSRNPLPLSASQEAQVRDIFYQKVRKECADEIKGTSPSTTTIPPPPSTPNHQHQLHATQSAHDEAREEWFALRIERQRERERKARVAQAQEEFMREWWGLPEHVRLSRQKEMEQRGERIHGLTAKDRPRGEGQ
ncbi:cytochrome c oxidase biogenesis [Fusarium napiforme]|uniref:Cytochrome c oxidase biogenesis n=1 Tax=Fusarium napiforme TaxID=42672 RepID=A0A8H5J3S9_9HYPO|nr:cytochrome c oxidase biogenesis [Fusarium napiforme]